MNKIKIYREVLHQLARSVVGTREGGRYGIEPVSSISDFRVSEAAERLARATALGPVELEIVR